MAYQPDTTKIPILNDPLKDRKLPIELRILHILNKRKGETSVKDITDYCNCNAKTREDFYAALRTLQTKGMIMKIEKKYKITPKGTDRIEALNEVLR